MWYGVGGLGEHRVGVSISEFVSIVLGVGYMYLFLQ